MAKCRTDRCVVTSSYLQSTRSVLMCSASKDEAGRRTVFMLIENEVYGAIITSDVIRAQSRTAVSSLKAMG